LGAFPSFRLEAAATITPKVTGDALASESDWGTIGVYARTKLEMVQLLWTRQDQLLQRAEAGRRRGGGGRGRALELGARGEAWMGRLAAARRHPG
jgi:hypothetical protein